MLSVLKTLDAQEIQRIAEKIDLRFHQLRRLIGAVAKGAVNGAVIHGRGGIGKTWTVEKELHELKAEGTIQLTTLTGHISPLKLYQTLMENATGDSVVLLDDVDTALTEINALNLLKAATDTKPQRWIHWASTSSKVDCKQFLYHGKVVVITNHDLTATAHYRAFMDRVASLNMNLSQQETLVRIAQIASKRPPAQAKEAAAVLQWIEKNLGHFSGDHLSMRVFEKAMAFALFDEEWESLAEASILRELK